MATLIDDATATEYFNGIENAPEDKRQQMADDLLAWGNAKQEQEYNQADEHFSKLFTDQAYFEQEKASNAAVLESPDPDQAAKRTLIGAYMEHKMGRPIDTMSYQVERDAFSMSAFGQKNINDGQLFDFISGDYETQQKKTEALNDLHMQSVGKAINDSQLGQNRPFVDGMTDVFNTWQQKYPELVDGTNDAAFLSQGYKLYYDTINDLHSVRPQAAQTLTTLEKFTKGEADPEALQTLSNTLIGVSPEERQKIYKYVTLAAEAGHIDRAGLDQFALNMGQSFSRGFDFIPQGSLQIQETGVNEVLQAVNGGQKVWVPQNGDITKATVSDKTPVAQTMAEAPTAFLFANPQKAYREATPEEADQFSSYAKNAMEGFKVVRELRNVAKTGVDPIRPVLEEKSFWGTAERGAYGLSGSIPLMGATAVNPYLGVIAYQANEYDRIMLENPDIDPQFAQGLALVEGAANAAIDRVQLKSLSGKLPMFGRYLDRIKNDGIRRTVKIGANVVEQNLQEGAQDLIAPVLETAVAALREDMPDKDFSSLMEGWAGQRAETFFATLPLALIGGGVASFRDIKHPSEELNATKLRMAGFSPEQTTFIQRAENPEEYDARIQMEFPNRTPDNIKAGEELIQQSISEAQNPPENSAKLEETVAKDGTRMWTVTTPDGKELLQTKDQQAALDAIAQHGHAQILNKQFETQYEPDELRQMITDLSTQWTSQDSNNTLVMESEGMNAQQKLEQLQAAGNAAQIQELHNRIANSPMKDSPYEQINILGEASVDDVAEMVFKPLITINPNTRPENLREEIHHTAVRVALKNGSVTLDTLRGWLDATEKALPGTFQNLVRDSEGDIVESLSQVQAAYENGKINADEETKLPPSFIGYIKNMMRTLAEVMRRAVALRGAFKDGALPAEYESFLADSVGLNQQARVDTASQRVAGDVLADTDGKVVFSRAQAQSNAGEIRASNATITGPANYSIGAFHGTPHKVDKFTTAKIGTGEGAQAYGWGLYFAQQIDVAQEYKDVLSSNQKYKDLGISPSPRVKTYLENAISQKFRIQFLKDDLERIQEDLQAHEVKAIDSFIKHVEVNGYPVNKGNLYTVDLDVEPEDLLDWDKPLSEQTESVRDAVTALIKDRVPKEIADVFLSNSEAGGGSLYTLISDSFGESAQGTPAKRASEALLAAGIPGIRYLDGGSRSEGQGTYNYVAFDESLIKITEENGNRIAAADALTSGQTNYSIGSMPEDQRAAEQSGQPSRGGLSAEVLSKLENTALPRSGPIVTIQRPINLKEYTHAELLQDGRISVTIPRHDWNSSPKDVITDALRELTEEPGYFWRGTNNINEQKILSELISKNHASGTSEHGVSVSRTLGLFAYDYYYKVTGEVSNTGSDGEPVLTNAAAAGPILTKTKARALKEKQLAKALKKIGWTKEQYRKAFLGEWEKAPDFNSPAPDTSATNYSIGKKDSLRVRMTRTALTDAALNQASWKDWYEEHQSTLDEFFGDHAQLFQDILSVTSQAASVKANVGLALKAFGQFHRGEEFSGFLPAVIKNLNRLRENTQVQGQKISAYKNSNDGKVDEAVIDRHIARLIFGVDSPSKAQFAKAQKILTEIANEIGWTPRQVQAALWAHSIYKSGKTPESYGAYLKKLESRGTLAERIGNISGRGGTSNADGGGRGRFAPESTADGAGLTNYSIRSVEHFKNDKRFDKLVKDGRVVIGHDIEEFKGMHILLHSPDNAFAGTIKLTDGEEIQGKGGVYYPALYANKNYFWASTEATVMTTAKHLNEIGQKNGGKILMALVSAPVEKLFSSTSMATGVVKFLNSLTSDTKAGLSKEDLNSMLVAASKVEFVKKGAKPKKFKMTLAKGDGLEKNLSKVDALLEPTGSIFQVRKMFSESLADQLSKHLKTNPEASNYVGGILADAENKHAKSAIKRGTLSKASIMQGLGNLFTEPFLRDFQDHGNGKIYAVLEVDGMVDGVASKAHDSYPFTLVPKNKKSKVKLHVLNQAVDWQDVVGRETGEYTTPEERMFLMPTSGMSAKTLKVLGVRGGSKSNPLNYSIASQSEIDRVNKALGGMNRGPDERLKVYQRAKQKFSKLMAWNSDELAAMADTGSDESQIRRTQILQALGELDGILSVLPPEVRGRVGGYTKLAGIAPHDVLKDGVKVSEVSGMNGAIISAWMREGQNIGQAGKQVSLPPGYTATENLSTKRADKVIADFFRDRIKRIDTELEKVLVREYTEAITKVVKQSRPKAGDNGVRKSTLGAETQKFADTVLRATLLDDEATAKRMAEIEAALTLPDATAEDISALSEEWSILNTFGDLDNRSSETLAQGLDWLKGQFQMGREAWRIKEQARIDEQRARNAATIEWLGKGTAKKRFADKGLMQRIGETANNYLLDHGSFEQFVSAFLPQEIASNFSERLRKADMAAQSAEIRDGKGIIDAVRAGAKAANMSAGDAMLWLKSDQKNAVSYLEGRKVKDERIAIDLAQKIVTGEADRSKLTDSDVETLRNELAALPADTQKEFVTIKRVIFRGEDVKLDMSRAKAMQLLLSWNQPDVQIKMRKEGWTDDSAADLKALVNDPVSREVMAYAKELYGKGAGIVNPVYSRMFGMNMPQVKNYAPTRFINAKDTKDIGIDGSPSATGTTPGFAKSRVTHSAKIAPEDALTVMQGHIAQQAHWVHFAELAREFRAILSNPEVRESLKQTHGDGVLKSAELWADQLEQRGGNKAKEIAWFNPILGTVLSGKAVSSLGFNLKTLAMQLDNTVRFGLALDMRQIVSALSNPSTIVEDIQTVWESDALQNRLQGGATAEARFLFSRYAGKPNFAAKIAEASMTPINWLDSAGTSISSAIVYRANLNDALAAGMPEALAKQTALDAASQAIYRFAQPVSFGQKSIVENNANVMGKMFFLFMSDARLKTAILADAARGLATGRGDKGTHMRRILAIETMAVLSHVVSSAFRDGLSDDDDDDIWNLGGFAKAILLAPLQGYFFAGTLGELAISKLTGQKTFNSTTQNPLLSSMEQAARAGNNLEDALNLDDPDAMTKEWNNIFRSMALSPAMAAPAVLLNMVKPVMGLYENAKTED